MDSVLLKSKDFQFSGLSETLETKKHNANELKSILFSRGKRTSCFFTEDSDLYLTAEQQKLVKKGAAFKKNLLGFDSVSSRIIVYYRDCRDDEDNFLYRALTKRCQAIKASLENGYKDFFYDLSPVKLWNISIAGAILIGMFSMALFYHYLGQGVSAGYASKGNSGKQVVLNSGSVPENSQVLGEEKEAEENPADSEEQYVRQIMENLEKMERSEKKEMNEEIEEMVKGYPIEKMVPYIMKKDKIVAAFLIGIAKKESNWGKRVPVLNGQDCYNYWGYKGKRKLMGTGGHTCFYSRKDAVDTVAKRLEWLIKNNKLNTPEKMIIWKCGSTCNGHSKYSVQKWISDVNFYFQKLNN